MPHTPTPSRRKTLQMLAGLPLLPLGAGASATGLLAACGGGSDSTAAFKSASFTGMAAPTLANPAAMATTTVGSALKATFDDGSTQSFALAYQPFFITGDMVSDGKGGKLLAGGYYDICNQPIIDTTVAGSERQFFSDAPDGSSLLTVPNAKVDGVKGKPVFAVVQFEYTTWAQDGKTDMYGKLPSPIAVLTLDQDQATGKLSLVKYHNVDTSKVYGLWITCGASLSPWGTHLSSEEYEPDAFTIESNAMFKAYSQNLYGDAARANPYHYGHMPEVTVNPDGTASIKKHFCMGRISHELVQVMPDQLPSSMAHIKSGKLIPVVLAADARSPELPNVPTFKELGYEELNELGISWFGIVVPKNTPAPIVKRLQDAAVKAAHLPDVQQHLKNLGANATDMDQSRFPAQIAQELKRNKALLDKAGVKPE